MKTRTLIGAALLLSTAGVGIALAAVDSDHLVRQSHRQMEHAERDGSHWRRLAERDDHNDRDDGASRHRYRDDEDDDDEDDDDHGGRGTLPLTGPSDPNAPVPDNGLFQGQARPKVEVQ